MQNKNPAPDPLHPYQPQHPSCAWSRNVLRWKGGPRCPCSPPRWVAKTKLEHTKDSVSQKTEQVLGFLSVSFRATQTKNFQH